MKAAPRPPKPPGFLSEHRAGCTLLVHLHPRARQAGIVGEIAGRLKVAVCAPPVDGKANRELCGLLAERLHLAKSRVTLASGAKARQKTLVLHGLSATQAAKQLLVPPPSSPAAP